MSPKCVAIALALVVAGCTTPAREEQGIEAASIEGTITIGDAFVLESARLSVAPANVAVEGTPGKPVALEEPPWVARTALLRDHWVLEATLKERGPASGLGEHRVRLDWNGELAGDLYIEGTNATAPLRVIVRFDVGASIDRSNVYAFEITRMP